jgi:hypothetical protein
LFVCKLLSPEVSECRVCRRVSRRVEACRGGVEVVSMQHEADG